MAIEKSTALILGAGASHGYGFPLGIELRNLVCLYLAEGKTGPLMDLGHTEDEIAAFGEDLRYSGYTSVDVFLEHNPGYLQIGKRAIAAILLPRENEDSLFPPGVNFNTHWYEYLINRMGVGTDDWNRNHLSVVTFNYDRSFEHYFVTVIGRRAQVGTTQAMQLFSHIPIVHVHGALGRYLPYDAAGLAYGPGATADNINAAANEILVVGEVADTLPTFGEAEKLLLAAERIYFLGFGFLPANLRRLRVFDHQWSSDDSKPFVGGTVMGFTNNEWAAVEPCFRGLWSGGRPSHSPLEFLRFNAELE